MMFRYSFNQEKIASKIEKSVEKTIEFGLRTKDISTDLDEPVGTKEMAKQIIKEYKKL